MNERLGVGLTIDRKTTVAFQWQSDLTYPFTPKPSSCILSGPFIERRIGDTEIVAKPLKAKTFIFTADHKFRNAS